MSRNLQIIFKSLVYQMNLRFKKIRENPQCKDAYQEYYNDVKMCQLPKPQGTICNSSVDNKYISILLPRKTAKS